jgi:hypothetical protein
MIIELHRAGLTNDSQAAKTQELYRYLSGDEFRQAFDVVLEAADELRGLLSKEQRWHEGNWAKRQQIYAEVGGKAASIDGRIRAIIERSSASKGKVVTLARHTAS